MSSNEELPNEELKKMIRLTQTFLHDQVNALKSDVNRAVGDAETALEISATLEKSMHSFTSDKNQLDKLVATHHDTLNLIQREIEEAQLNLKRTRILSGLTGLCFSLSIQMVLYSLVTTGEKKSSLVGQIIKLVSMHTKIFHELSDAKTEDELNSIGNKFIDGYLKVRKQLTKQYTLLE